MHTQVRRESEQPGWFGVPAAIVAVVVVVGSAFAPRAALATEIRYFQTPFAQARVFGRETGPERATDWRMDADFNQNEIAPKHAIAGVPTASALASASLLQQAPSPRFGLVSAKSSEIGEARAQIQVLFEVRDPQNRTEVMVDMQFKGAANVQVGGLATMYWRLDRDSTLLGEVGIDEGKIVYVNPPPPPPNTAPMRSGFARVSRYSPNGPGFAQYESYVNGVQVGFRQENSDSLRAPTFGAFPMKPGFYVIDILVSTSGPALSVADPVIVAGPANPDVAVEIHAAFDPVPRSAFFGLGPDELEAEGFDTTPFEDLGLLVPDGDEDGWVDDLDNCPLIPNDQANADLDELGDPCDPDDDGDGVADEIDNCPGVANFAQEDGDGDGIGDACDADGRVVHDLAVVALKAPAVVTLKAASPSQTKQIQVGVQNRGASQETISDAAALARLVRLEVESLGACPMPSATLVPPKKLPVVLKPKQTLNVAFAVSFECANDPAKSTKTEPHADYRFSASLAYDEVAGGVDGHPEDDACPRSVEPPYESDPRSGVAVKDKGCGAKKADGTFGGEVVTDVVMKP